MSKFHKALLVSVPLFLTVCILITKFDFRDTWDGLYLLKGEKGFLFELKDDLLLGEYERLLFKFEFDAIRARLFTNSPERPNRVTPYLDYSWDSAAGKGYFLTFFPDGTKFLTCLGRYVDDDKRQVHGLFVGGGLPATRYESGAITLNETGVAYFDGRKWQHIWCIANEVLFSSLDPYRQVPPSAWTFLGSKLLFGTQDDLIIKSSHSVELAGVPVRIDRYLIYNSGNRYFHLVNRLTNAGSRPVTYHYIYGDEPWIGDFGSSKGNVGWTRDRIYTYEAAINPALHDFIGMYDLGNEVIGERKGGYTGLANFIEWQGAERPDFAYFANQTGRRVDEAKRIPLAHDTNRLMMVQWADRTLAPGQSRTMILAIGMTGPVVAGGMPVKPDTRLDEGRLAFALAR